MNIRPAHHPQVKIWRQAVRYITRLRVRLGNIYHGSNIRRKLRGALARAIARVESRASAISSPIPPSWKLDMFSVRDDWITEFTIEGQTVGGRVKIFDDTRVLWHLAVIGGAEGKRVLELGPLEGAHTKTLIEHGAREVIAIEGLPTAWLKCLIIKEIFELQNVRFLYGDFCQYVRTYAGDPFDFVLASGVLYHQANPASLVHDLARITDQVCVWSQVAGDIYPINGSPIEITAAERTYRGQLNDYHDARNTVQGFCGGVAPAVVWLYPDELRRAFRDAGFQFIVEQPIDATPGGPSVLFVASKTPNLKELPYPLSAE
jgi:hypothetical protein